MKILYFVPIIILYLTGWVYFFIEREKSYWEKGIYNDIWGAVHLVAVILAVVVLAIIGISN